MARLHLFGPLAFTCISAAAAALSHGHQEWHPVQFITAVNRTQPLTLEVSPACGPLGSNVFTEVNTGIKLNATKYAYYMPSRPFVSSTRFIQDYRCFW